jgi:hypothetical protein
MRAMTVEKDLTIEATFEAQGATWRQRSGREDPMRTHRLMTRAAWFLALFLGQASLLIGLMTALAWALAFAVFVPTKAHAWMTGQGAGLLIEPPLIGLAIGTLGLLVARWSREPVARFSVAGMLFNGLALVLAVLSIVAASAR